MCACLSLHNLPYSTIRGRGNFKALFQSSILVGESFGKLLYSYNRNSSDGEYNIGEFMVINLLDLPIFSPATVLCGIIIMGMSYCYNYWWCTFV